MSCLTRPFKDPELFCSAVSRSLQASIEPFQKFVGLDLSPNRIGIAISDNGGKLAIPYGSLETVKSGFVSQNKIQLKPVESNLIDGLKKEKIIGWIVGWPLGRRSNEHRYRLSQTLVQIKKFSEIFGGEIGPILLHDERFSTMMAKVRYQEFPCRFKKCGVDSIAASVILQEFLDFAERSQNLTFEFRMPLTRVV